MARFFLLVLALVFAAVVASASADDSNSGAGVLTQIAKSPLPADSAADGPAGNKGDESEAGSVGAPTGAHPTNAENDSAVHADHKSVAASVPFVGAVSMAAAAAISVVSCFVF